MSLTHRFVRPIALGFVALLTANCSTPTGPLRPGTYVLRSVDGQTVPFTRTLVGGETLTYLADTLWFRADGSASEVTVERFVNTATGRDEVVRWTSGYRYVVRGSAVEFTYSPPPCFTLGVAAVNATSAGSAEGQGEGGCSYVQPVGKLTRAGIEMGSQGSTEWRKFERVGN